MNFQLYPSKSRLKNLKIQDPPDSKFFFSFSNGRNENEGLVHPSLFDHASNIHGKATESGSNDQELVMKGIEYLEKCEEVISTLDLFSSNETKEDICTTNLKYILVPFYLAELAEKILQDDRVQILKASQANLKEFLSFCEAMELVPEEELQASSQGAPNTFVDRRALKIARYKRQRAAEAKLEEIKERKERSS